MSLEPSSAADPRTASAARTKFTYTRCPGVPTISALAAPLGLLDAEFGDEPDLDVTIKTIGFTGKLHYSHDERLWIRNAGHAPAMWAHSHGVDNRIVALAWLEGYYPVYVAAQSAIQTPADLRGKRLGLLSAKDSPFDLIRAQQLKIYETTLKTAGLTLDDVELVVVERPHPKSGEVTPDFRSVVEEFRRQFAQRLARGEFDAANVPFLISPPAELRSIYDTRNHPDPLARVNPSVLRGVAVSGAILRERRDLVVRALTRLLEAGDWALEHPTETGLKLAENYGIPPALLVPNYVNLSQGVQIDLADDKIAALQVQKDFLLRHGFIPRDFDINPWVDHGPLEEARALHQARAREPKRPALAATA